MGKNKFTKAVFVLLVITMMASLFVGCGEEKDEPAVVKTTQTQAPVEQKNTIPLYTERKDTKGMSIDDILKGDIIYSVPNINFPISKEPITLTFMKPAIQDDADMDKMPILADYEKKTNIHIEWNTPQAADFEDKYNLLMASGQYPDAIFSVPETDIEKFGQQGLFIQLNDLIDQNMPNLMDVLSTNANAKKIITTDEGKIFGMPFVNCFVTGNNVMMVREDWLKKLGLNMPETIDEWYNVLKAFKAMDPENIWPMSSYGQYEIRCQISAWGVFPEGFYAAPTDGLCQPKDGKMHFGPIEPLYKEGLEWLNKLYKEKLIDPEFITNDDKAFQAKVMQDKVGAWRGWVNGDMYVLNETAKKNGKTDLHIIEGPIIKGPHGDQVHMWRNTDASANGMVITKNNKYPKETAIWADYWYSEWGRTYVYGVENVTYTVDSSGQPRWTDYVVKNAEGKTSNQVRGSVTFGRNAWPCVFQPWTLTGSTLPQDIEDGRVKYRKEELLVNPLPQGLSFSTSDNDLISSKMNDINTYVDEMFVKFVTGKEPLANWDAYVKEVNDMGMPQLLEIYNKSYEKWMTR